MSQLGFIKFSKAVPAPLYFILVLQNSASYEALMHNNNQLSQFNSHAYISHVNV
jgi:hypothetical protein